MKKMGFLLVLVLSVFLPLKGWTDNSCVQCHQSLSPSLTRAHDFKEWKESVHSQKGITCENCHGGNPTEKDSKKAHAGVLKSGNPKSPLYFSQIPETCGRCHAAELAAFKKSFHYSELKRSGHGPNCLTCHGSMATGVLEPKQMEQACSLCHEHREVASEALVTLNLAGSTLKKWEKTFDQAMGKTTAAEKKALKEQQEAYQQIQRKWHSFDMGAVIEGAKKIVAVAREETQALKLKGAR